MWKDVLSAASTPGFSASHSLSLSPSLFTLCPVLFLNNLPSIVLSSSSTDIEIFLVSGKLSSVSWFSLLRDPEHPKHLWMSSTLLSSALSPSSYFLLIIGVMYYQRYIQNYHTRSFLAPTDHKIIVIAGHGLCCTAGSLTCKLDRYIPTQAE